MLVRWCLQKRSCGFENVDRCPNRFLSRGYGFCPDLSAVVQDDEGGRDYRTEPEVLTPGTDKKGTRPEAGGREAFSALDAERDPQSISAAPFLLRPLLPELRGQAGRGPIVNVSWG